MIRREYYTLYNNRRFYLEHYEDLIHLAATGKISIHALVSNLAIEPYSINSDRSYNLLDRKQYTGLVQLETKDVMRFEADGTGYDVRTVQLPPFDGTLYAFPLRWVNYGEPGFGKDISTAKRVELVIYDSHLVITDQEAEKAESFFAAEVGEPPSDNLLGKEDKPLGTKERRTLLTIIAALCDHAKIDPSQRGAAKRIMLLVEQIGAKVDEGTVKKFLDEIPDALESRMK